MIELILQVLAGLGLAFIGDKVLPAPAPPTPDYRSGISTWGPLKIGVFAVILAVGAFLAIFVGKKLHIIKSRR